MFLHHRAPSQWSLCIQVCVWVSVTLTDRLHHLCGQLNAVVMMIVQECFLFTVEMTGQKNNHNRIQQSVFNISWRYYCYNKENVGWNELKMLSFNYWFYPYFTLLHIFPHLWLYTEKKIIATHDRGKKLMSQKKDSLRQRLCLKKIRAAQVLGGSA